MKKVLLVVSLFLFSSILFAQKIKISENELKTQLDAVLKEGNLLYKYVQASLVAVDSALVNPIINKPYSFWSYFPYEDSEKIKIIIFVGNTPTCIAEYTFEDDFTKPKSVIIERRELTTKEKTLMDIRDKIVAQIRKPKYGLTFDWCFGCTMEFILIPDIDSYKFYCIIRTTEHSEEDIIPFGNDYLFIANKKGKIKRWYNFHSEFIPWHPIVDGNRVTEVSHSHLTTTPLVTATDICTFKLYAPLYDIDEFFVYSTALGKYMKYNWKKNEILVISED